MSPNYPENKATPKLRVMTKEEATLYCFKGFKDGSMPLRTELSAIAVPELGLFPMMTVDGEGIWITREDAARWTVTTYLFKTPREWPKEQVLEFAAHVLEIGRASCRERV